MSEFVETYCGCDIYRELSGVYTSPCTVYARFTVERVRQDIQAGGYCGEPEPEPEPEPDPKVFIETYRGVDIYYDNEVYRYWFEYEAVPYSPATLNEAYTWIDSLIEPPAEEPHWEYHSTYRGIDIQVWMPDGTPFTAYFDGEWHMAASLSTIQSGIDAFLEDDISTTITISAPSNVEEGESFNISGILNESNTGLPVPYQTISLSYNGKSLGSATTGVDGDYLKQASIPSAGVYTLKATFSGTTLLGPSEATSKLSTAGLGLLPLLAILGGGAVGAFYVLKMLRR